MATYQVEVASVRRPAIDAPTGDYRLVVAMAVALADVQPLPVTVTIWCDDLLPTYGPYRYRVQTDRFGNLVVGTYAASTCSFRTSTRRHAPSINSAT